MNQLANVALSASRKYAGMGDVEAADIWNLWHNLVCYYFHYWNFLANIGIAPFRRYQ